LIASFVGQLWLLGCDDECYRLDIIIIIIIIALKLSQQLSFVIIE
jgi:hypothetical protein